MRMMVNKSLLALAIAGVLAAPVAHATNGYFGHGYSTKEKGVGGAGTAFSQDALASATNPAGMVFVGSRIDVGAALFAPSPRSYTLTGTPGPTSGINAAPNQKVESDKDLFLIPHFGYNHMLGDDKAVGISIYGNGGMNTQYEASDTPFGAGTFGAGTTGVNLEQVFFNFSFAKKIKSKHAFGASVIIAAQRFSAQGIESFGGFSQEPTRMSGDIHDVSWGAGLKVGYQGEVSKGLRLGVSYQSKISMDEFDDYKGLFAEGGDFDIPSTYNIGISYDVTPSSMIIADIQRINYSDVAAISNTISPLINGQCNPAVPGNPNNTGSSGIGAGCLGGASGAGFGWDDIMVIKLGYQFDVGDNTYRVGYSHSEQPVPDSETLFNILAPAVIQDHFTAGATIRLTGDQEFNISGMYAPSESVKGDNPFDGGATQIEIEMSQWEIQAGWAWKY